MFPKKLAICLCLVDIVFSAAVREVELSTNWILKNQNETIKKDGLKIPSGVYSALYREEVLESYNDVNMRWIAYDNWTYSRIFSVVQEDYETVRFVNLTLHGIDTVSKIKLNGHPLGTTDNMFVRYSFDIKDLLVPGQNFLEITITSPVHVAKNLAAKLTAAGHLTPPECPPEMYNGECHMNMLRKMQASFGWDWGLAAPSMGIWKTVTLEFHDCAILRDVDVITTQKLRSWDVTTRVYPATGMNESFYWELVFYAVELLDKPFIINYKNFTIDVNRPVIEFTINIPKSNIRLWWPNGYGEQKLYPLHFTLNTWKSENGPDARQLTTSQKSLRIGFRTIELIQEEMANGDSFYFRVNNVPMFMKGSNYIPSHILPELSADQERIKHLLTSAKETHMNMLRVWGGGIYESDYFYDMADYLGILIWQDMMFACAMYPANDDFLKSVREETIQNSLRLSHHPSVAIFAGNNENEAALVQNWYGTTDDYNRYAAEYRELYVGTVYNELMHTIADKSRPEPLISSPSNGRLSQADQFLSKNPQSPNYGDIHFYDIVKNGWDPNIYPRPRFSSEYGFQSLPAMTTWKRVQGAHDDLNDLMHHRQHHPQGMLAFTLLVMQNLPFVAKDDPRYLESLIYFSQIAQAMGTKTETEVYRSEKGTDQNTMGALYWQLNDVWVAPSWSSIDFYGNYKLLHYWAKEFLAPISIIALYDSASDSVNVTISRDDIEPKDFRGTVTMNTFLWSELFPRKELTWETEVKPNSNKWDKVIKMKDILEDTFNKNNCFVEFVLKNGRNIISRTYFYPAPIKAAIGVQHPLIKVEISNTRFCQPPLNSYSLSVTVEYPAIFVYIEIEHPEITNYKLSKNGFMQVEPIQIIHLEFSHKSCIDLKSHNIKVLTVNEYFNY